MTNQNKYKIALGWTIGYFAILYPIFYALDGSLVRGLMNGIIGLIGTIIFLKYGDKL